MHKFAKYTHCHLGFSVTRSNWNPSRPICVLGIETSCDDTAIAVVNSKEYSGVVLANVVNSQQKVHTRYGGIIPPRAQELHRKNVAAVFERCMQESGIAPDQLDAIAVTTRPGLPLSLLVGLRFARHLARKYAKPLIPVHHMEAHALQVRMEQQIAYPFLCLLISGGHSQLAFVRNAQNFALLGECLDDAPGEAFDKIARRLRLSTLPKYRYWNGGQAIEHAAKKSLNPQRFAFPLPLANRKNCNFSFAAFKNNSHRTINLVERLEDTAPDGIISQYKDFCAGLLCAFSRHITNRTQRGIEYCIAQGLFASGPRSVVVSGGVANNDHIFTDIANMAQQFDCLTFRPSKKYCSDNGVMIAWNGIEQIVSIKNCLRWNYDNIDVEGKCTLGDSLVNDVELANVKCKWVQPKNTCKHKYIINVK